MRRFPLLKSFLLKDAESETWANEGNAAVLTIVEWKTLRAKYSIPSEHGVVCIIEFDEEAGKLTRYFAKQLNRSCFCLYNYFGSRGCFFLSGGIKRGRVEKLLASICKTLSHSQSLKFWKPPLTCIFAAGENRLGTSIELSFIDALSQIKILMGRQERRLKDRLRIRELRRRIGVADAEEMRRLFKLLTGDIFTNSTFTLAKTRIIVIFTLLWDDLTGYWGGGKHEDSRTYINDKIGKLDFREIMAWKILHLKNFKDWEKWSEESFNFLLEAARQRTASLPPPMLKAIDYIQEHYKDDLTRGKAAEAAHVSPAYLSRLFSQKLNTTFSTYLTDLRIAKASCLLRETGLSIKEIAFAVGFHNPDYFSKVFKKLKGMSVSDARQR
jgi:two-component system response regulator YesN